MAKRLGKNINCEGSYAVVNSKGEIVEKFRAKATALSWMWKLKNTYRDELKIIDIPNNDEN